MDGIIIGILVIIMVIMIGTHHFLQVGIDRVGTHIMDILIITATHIMAITTIIMEIITIEITHTTLVDGVLFTQIITQAESLIGVLHQQTDVVQ